LQVLARRVDADVIVMGHTHQAFTHRINSQLLINPGVVGRALDGNTQAAYAVLGTDSLEIRLQCVAYDLYGAVRMIKKSGVPLEIARLVEHGARRIEDLDHLGLDGPEREHPFDSPETTHRWRQHTPESSGHPEGSEHLHSQPGRGEQVRAVCLC
jgi:hypothetical protein